MSSDKRESSKSKGGGGGGGASCRGTDYERAMKAQMNTVLEHYDVGLPEETDLATFHNATDKCLVLMQQEYLEQARAAKGLCGPACVCNQDGTDWLGTSPNVGRGATQSDTQVDNKEMRNMMNYDETSSQTYEKLTTPFPSEGHTNDSSGGGGAASSSSAGTLPGATAKVHPLLEDADWFTIPATLEKSNDDMRCINCREFGFHFTQHSLGSDEGLKVGLAPELIPGSTNAFIHKGRNPSGKFGCGGVHVGFRLSKFFADKVDMPPGSIIMPNLGKPGFQFRYPDEGPPCRNDLTLERDQICGSCRSLYHQQSFRGLNPMKEPSINSVQMRCCNKHNAHNLCEGGFVADRTPNEITHEVWQTGESSSWGIYNQQRVCVGSRECEENEKLAYWKSTHCAWLCRACFFEKDEFGPHGWNVQVKCLNSQCEYVRGAAVHPKNYKHPHNKFCNLCLNFSVIEKLSFSKLVTKLKALAEETSNMNLKKAIEKFEVAVKHPKQPWLDATFIDHESAEFLYAACLHIEAKFQTELQHVSNFSRISTFIIKL